MENTNLPHMQPQAAEPTPEPSPYKAAPRFDPPPVITFEKVTADDTKLRPGAIWTWSYKHLSAPEALGHALKHLKGEGEDPLHWKQLP